MLIQLVVFLLRRKNLSLKDRNLLTTALLDKLGAVPINDIIKTNDGGQLIVNNRIVDLEMARKLRESARGALESIALQFVHEQVTFKAITLGVHKLTTPEEGIFAKAALWQGQEERQALRTLAQIDASELDLSE